MDIRTLVHFTQDNVQATNREMHSAGAVSCLPQELILKIFSYLNALELGRCQGVCREWRLCASDEGLWKKLPRPSQVFGRQEWEEYFGDCGEEPSLPKEIHRLLISPCPFWLGKRVEETHVLVLIPQTLEGQPLKLDSLYGLTMWQKKGHRLNYHYDSEIAEEVNQLLAPPAHWVLMTRQVIPNSCDKSYANQQALLAHFNKQARVSYVVPSVWEAAVCMLTHYAITKEYLLGSILTRCQERSSYDWLQFILFEKWESLVGVVPRRGILVLCVVDSIQNDLTGLAALRRLS